MFIVEFDLEGVLLAAMGKEACFAHVSLKVRLLSNLDRIVFMMISRFILGIRVNAEFVFSRNFTISVFCREEVYNCRMFRVSYMNDVLLYFGKSYMRRAV